MGGTVRGHGRLSLLAAGFVVATCMAVHGTSGGTANAQEECGDPEFGGTCGECTVDPPPPPDADAGPDQSVDEGAAASLIGVATSWDDLQAPVCILAEPITPSPVWEQTGGPSVVLSNPLTLTPSFTAPAYELGNATLTFKLSNSNTSGLTASDTVDIFVRDIIPPMVALTGVTNTTYVQGQVPEPGCDTTDSGSGVLQEAIAQVVGGPLGELTVTCSGALDMFENEGNVTSVSYVVVAPPTTTTTTTTTTTIAPTTTAAATTTTVDPASRAVAPTTASPALPATGGPTRSTALYALLAALAGTALVVTARRRSTTNTRH